MKHLKIDRAKHQGQAERQGQADRRDETSTIRMDTGIVIHLHLKVFREVNSRFIIQLWIMKSESLIWLRTKKLSLYERPVAGLMFMS